MTPRTPLLFPTTVSSITHTCILGKMESTLRSPSDTQCSCYGDEASWNSAVPQSPLPTVNDAPPKATPRRPPSRDASKASRQSPSHAEHAESTLKTAWTSAVVLERESTCSPPPELMVKPAEERECPPLQRRRRTGSPQFQGRGRNLLDDFNRCDE